jgi:hypothetical protein
MCVAGVTLAACSSAQSQSHSLHDMKKLNRLSEISGRFRDAQKNGDLNEAKSILETELIPETSLRVYRMTLARLEFEMDDITEADKNLAEYLKATPLPLEENGWSLSVKIFGQMVSAAKKKAQPYWSNLRPTANGYTPTVIMDSECQMAIACGYVRTAKKYLQELPNVGEPAEDIAILQKRLDTVERKQAEYKAAKHEKATS